MATKVEALRLRRAGVDSELRALVELGRRQVLADWVLLLKPTLPFMSVQP